MESRAQMSILPRIEPARF
ncbi:hypothetical protein [Sphingobium lactosutens]